ncbi:DUF1254 domain-containing protein [Galbibacter sp. PAP.153]|uniref:DUF1254 domain-containing protein n=1 Tax=Galbibacter sp. PAP.153 TaxID=3104623 RepID=UPI00300823D5
MKKITLMHIHFKISILFFCCNTVIFAQHEDGHYPPLDPTKIYKQWDLENLTRAYCDLQPEAAFMALYNSYLKEGSTAQNIGIMETSVNAKLKVLTANSTTIYAVHPVNLNEQGGAVVVEVPAGMMGMANAPGWVNIIDIGGMGPDKGKGGKYLFTSPEYNGEIPEGYFHYKSPANTIVWLLRGFVKNGDRKATVKFMQEGIKTYSLKDADNPPATTFYNTSNKMADGHFMDMLYDETQVFDLIKEFVKLNNGACYKRHDVIMSYLYDMGFFEGKVDKELLKKAAELGELRQRTLTFNNRVPDVLKWPGKSN